MLKFIVRAERHGWVLDSVNEYKAILVYHGSDGVIREIYVYSWGEIATWRSMSTTATARHHKRHLFS